MGQGILRTISYAIPDVKLGFPLDWIDQRVSSLSRIHISTKLAWSGA